MACPLSATQSSSTTPAPTTPAPTSSAEAATQPPAPVLDDGLTREQVLLELERVRRSSSGGARMRELKRRIRHFTPSWFSITMGTGITSILLHELPYQFPGLKIIAAVLFVLNVVLFCLFLAMSIARYVMYPSLWKAMLFHPVQSLFLGTFSMGFSTIVNCTVLFCASWGYGWIMFAWALWWLSVAISLAVCIGVPYVMFVHHVQAFSTISGAWLLPSVSSIVSAASGGIVAAVLPAHHARLTVIVSYILWGTGFPPAFLLMALYFGRLAIHKAPPAAQVISCFLPLGPCGQGAFAFLQLSKVIISLSSADATSQGLPSPSSFSAADNRIIALAIHAVSVPISLVMWGLGLFWVVIALMTVGTLAIRKSVPFNIGFWALTFPLGVWTTATTSLARDLNSSVLRVLGTVFSVLVALLWIGVALQTSREAWAGRLFQAPCLGDMAKQEELDRLLEAEQKEATSSRV